MRTALIVTFGFDEKFCYRAILRNGIKDGDRIILLTAGVVEKVKRAYDNIEKFVSTSYSNVSVDLVEIDPKYFVLGVKKVLEIVKSLEGCRVVVNLSGGMRVLSLMVCLALTIADKDVEVEIELEDFSGVLKLPIGIFELPRVLSRLSDEKVKLLKVLEREGELEALKLAEIVRRDATTVRRHIYELEELGLIEVTSRKPLRVKITDLAVLV